MSILKFTEDHEWLRVEGDVATVQLLDGTTFQNEAGFEGGL